MGTDKASNARRANLPFGRLIIDTLTRCGVEHFVLSPGSRSTPLALAVAEPGKDLLTVCLDERSAAYQALGRIKATRRPAAVICTSGTAAAQCYPAVIEARESALPLIVLTADRPPELRHCHAGQTIDQLKLYGTYPVFQAELPLPEPDLLLLRQVREVCRRAVEAATAWNGGPVHLNCPFREPFFSTEEDTCWEIPDLLLEGLVPTMTARSVRGEGETLPERTLILAGPRPWADPASETEALVDLAIRRGYPILADGANPLRYHPAGKAAIIVHYDRIVRNDSFWTGLRPQAVLLWGEPPTSKLLRQKLEELDLPGIQIGYGKSGLNPIHGRIECPGISVEAFASGVSGGAGSFGEAWLEADKRIELALTQALTEPHPVFEGDIHRLLGRILPADSPVCLASSLAVRDFEWFMPRRHVPLQPHSQRGANGIDGTVSLARGVAAGGRRPAFLVTGDLALLHDTNGLMDAARLSHGLFIVLINNRGGGIFEFLPIAGLSESFERVFATPQAVDFKPLVEAHGGRYVHAPDLATLERSVRDWDGSGITVAEVPVDRKASRVLHRKFLSIKP